MPALKRHRAPSSSQLLSHILGTPSLVAAVRKLPPNALAKLIDHVGLEDAGELVALASGEQLHRVLDEDLWSGSQGGEQEHFQAERFALWLAILSEEGDAALVRRLSDMPVELLTLGIQQLVCVLDTDALAESFTAVGEAAEPTEEDLGSVCEEFEEFVLFARDETAWDVVWNALLCLDRDHHALVRDVLGRCAAANRTLGDDSRQQHFSEAELLEDEATDQREARRAARGYVSAGDARAFLALARSGGCLDQRDPITRAYFRQLETNPVPSKDLGGGQEFVPEAATDGHAEELLEVLRDSEVLPARDGAKAVLGLLAAGDGPSSTPPLLTSLMQALGERSPRRQAALVEELGYLANVLVALADKANGLSAADAFAAAVAVCDVGLEAWPSEPASGPGLLDTLAQVPGDRLFRHGIRMLCEGAPRGPAAALEAWLELLVTPLDLSPTNADIGKVLA